MASRLGHAQFNFLPTGKTSPAGIVFSASDAVGRSLPAFISPKFVFDQKGTKRPHCFSMWIIRPRFTLVCNCLSIHRPRTSRDKHDEVVFVLFRISRCMGKACPGTNMPTRPSFARYGRHIFKAKTFLPHFVFQTRVL